MIKEFISPPLGRDDVYVVTTHDGSDTLYSKAYQVTYHSIYGAVTESKHTYIQNCLLTQGHRERIKILEFGFGTGLNAFLAFLYARKFQKQVDYTGLDRFPIDLSVIKNLDYPGYLTCPDSKDVFHRMHELTSFKEENFHFQRIDHVDIFGMTGSFDCIFFDAFDPSAQPELWDQLMFNHLHQLTSPGGCLVTYSAKGEVRRHLSRAGYNVHRIPGSPGKREMLKAFKAI